MMKKKIAYLALGSLILVTSAVSVLGNAEVAKINGSVISLEAFNKKYRENLRFFQFKAPTKKGVLDDLIKRELGIQEARKLGLDKDPEIQDRMNTVLYHALIDRKLSKEFDAIHVTDDEAKEFYARNPEVRTSHIFVAVAPDATPEQVKKAQEKIKDIQATKLKDGKMSFAEVAQRFSEGSAAPMGGDIDYKNKTQLDPRYYAEAIRLKTPGKMSDIVRSQFGFHIIKLTAVRPWEEVDRGQVKRLVFDEKRQQIFDKYMVTLRSQAKVTVNDALLKE